MAQTVASHTHTFRIPFWRMYLPVVVYGTPYRGQVENLCGPTERQHPHFQGRKRPPRIAIGNFSQEFQRRLIHTDIFCCQPSFRVRQRPVEHRTDHARPPLHHGALVARRG